jgi:hypothetical protein
MEGNDMVANHALGLAVLALAVFGLLAVLAEAAVKNPAALLEVLIDSRRMAQPLTTNCKGRAVIGYCEPKAAANSGERLAA